MRSKRHEVDAVGGVSIASQNLNRISRRAEETSGQRVKRLLKARYGKYLVR